jgi:hypothetical protein
MPKEFLLFIKYPYTAGVIATVWLGSAAMMAIDRDLPIITMVTINMVATGILAGFGFRGKKEL